MEKNFIIDDSVSTSNKYTFKRKTLYSNMHIYIQQRQTYGYDTRAKAVKGFTHPSDGMSCDF